MIGYLEMLEKITNVSIGIISQKDGKILFSRRPKDKSWSGWWELPGGKIKLKENPLEALKREMLEELGIHVIKAYPWITFVYSYQGSATIRLIFFRIVSWQGYPSNLENQILKWLHVNNIPGNKGIKILPSLYTPLRYLRLPTTYGITSIGSTKNATEFLYRLNKALSNGLRLLQFREPNWPEGKDSESLHFILQKVIKCCHHSNANLLVNSIHPKSWWGEADGVHLRSDDLGKLNIRSHISKKALLGVSTHNHFDLIQAQNMDADFAVLGPVSRTLTHPEVEGIGWTEFRELSKNVGIPIFALGGQSHNTREVALENGAHGISGIRFLT